MNCQKSIIQNKRKYKKPILQIEYKTILYIKYKKNNKIFEQELIQNTINIYKDNLKKALEIDKRYSEYKTKRRFKNRLSDNELNSIQKKFDFNNIYDLDEVVSVGKKPYFLNYYQMLNSLNNIRYIIAEQLKPNIQQYNYKNYEKHTNDIIHESLELDKELTAFEAAFQKGIILTYKENNILGSIIIKSLQMPFIEKLKNTKFFSTLKNSQNFQRKFAKVNF